MASAVITSYTHTFPVRGGPSLSVSVAQAVSTDTWRVRVDAMTPSGGRPLLGAVDTVPTGALTRLVALAYVPGAVGFEVTITRLAGTGAATFYGDCGEACGAAALGLSPVAPFAVLAPPPPP